MATAAEFLTVDLGAESGRAMMARVSDRRLEIEEIHRFANEPQRLPGGLYWNPVALFREIKTGLGRAVRDSGADLRGIGVDTWGVDFALLDRRGELLGLPYHYRDHRTDGVMEETFARVPRETIYRRTGIQFMQLNTLFQLMALRLQDSPLLGAASRLLMVPDLLNFWLTGIQANEQTIASTTQCYDPVAADWARDLLDSLEIPASIFGEIIPPGANLGPLHAAVAEEVGASGIPVIATASHDTASAVAGVPADSATRWAYISCGTWSLVGVEEERPVITDLSLACNLTNEGGVGGAIRLLRNVMGLWLLQQCRRSWERQGRAYSYHELAALADSAPPFAAILDPDDASFLNPPDMPSAIEEYCRRSGQKPPDGPAATVRCIIESLALKYRWVIERLEEVTSRPIAIIHLIGGGSRNTALCQATADATNRVVLAGPVEATAAGNTIVQALSAGALGSLSDGRALIRRSFPLVEYAPRDAGAWDEAYHAACALWGI